MVSPEPSRTGPWQFIHAPGVHRFELRSTAVVESLDDGRTDTTALSAYFTYVAARERDTLVITGSVDSISVDAITDSAPQAPPVPADSQPSVFPISFTMRIDSAGQVTEFASPDTSSCGSPAGTLLAIARDLMITVPHQMTIGTRWEDTTTMTSCRGDIPITLTSVRSYTLTGPVVENGRVQLRVRRETSSDIIGTGTRRVQTTSVTGNGHGWSELLLDPQSGQFLGGHGESTIELTFDAASRRMAFRQRTQQVIRRL